MNPIRMLALLLLALSPALFADTLVVTADRMFDADSGRIVMELVSALDQSVRIDDAQIQFAAGETITTEYSHKYTLDDFEAMARIAGFSVARVWTDPRQWFAVHYCVRD